MRPSASAGSSRAASWASSTILPSRRRVTICSPPASARLSACARSRASRSSPAAIRAGGHRVRGVGWRGQRGEDGARQFADRGDAAGVGQRLAGRFGDGVEQLAAGRIRRPPVLQGTDLLRHPRSGHGQRRGHFVLAGKGIEPGVESQQQPGRRAPRRRAGPSQRARSSNSAAVDRVGQDPGGRTRRRPGAAARGR